MFPTTGPEPATMVMAALQVSADANYQNVVLPSWESQNQSYITQGQARMAANEPVITLPPPIPSHTVYSIDANGNIAQSQVVDPSLKLAVIPPPTPQVIPTTDIIAPQSGPNEQTYFQTIIELLMEIKAKVCPAPYSDGSGVGD